MKVREVMTPDAQCVSPDDLLIDAAGLMRQLDVGAIPVCESDRLAGMLTDRDIVLRAVAEGLDGQRTTVREVMSPGIVCIYEDQDAEEAARTMQQHQIRRLPVLNREQRMIGIVSLGDLAVDASARLSGDVLKDVSEPAEPVR